jgi:hypothetical protein
VTSPSEVPSTSLAGSPATVESPVGQPEPFVGPPPGDGQRAVPLPQPQPDNRAWGLGNLGAQARRVTSGPSRPALHGRRVKRIVRRVELWSVLKVSLLFYACVYVVTLLSGVFLWGFAYSAGLIDNFESFMADVGFDDFQFYGDEIFRRAAIIGAVLVLAGAVLTVLATALINVISELTGGIRFVVIEVVEPVAPSRQPGSELAPPRWRDDLDPASGRW